MQAGRGAAGASPYRPHARFITPLLAGHLEGVRSVGAVKS